MKVKVSFLIVALFTILFSSCESNEEKAANLIKSELSKTLYDFESYEPIETIVTEAYNTVYNDSTCFGLAMAIAFSMEKASKAMEESKKASERMDIWGPPSYYSSSYSDKKYYKYRDEAKEKASEAFAAYVFVKSLSSVLEDSIKALDDSKVIGWEAKHRFRCKTKGGQNTIGDFRYIISPDFKTIIFREDMDDDDYSQAREVIEEAEKGSFSKLDLND